jgi:iron complex outermembrane receptor protein
MHFPKTLLATTIAGALAAPTTLAQEASDENLFTLEEIVVSARKIEESAQDIPVAINVMDSSTVEDLKIQGMTDVIKYTPGATFTSNFAGENNVSIRGISSGDNSASGSSGVLLMADNEVISRDFMYSGALFDIARVEVLRGPQGTTYGKNATGGVVHTLSNLPTDEFEATIKTTVGNYDLYGLETVINTPINENMASRVALYHQQREGYSEDSLTGKSVDDTDTQAIKGSLVWSPTDSVDLTFRAHWSKDNYDNPAPRKALDPSQPDVAIDPAIFVSTDVSNDPYEVRNSDNLFYDREIWGASVEAVIGFDGFDLTSITTYRNGEDDVRVDLFGSYEDLVVQNSTNDATTFSQEIRLDNAAHADELTWQTGFYYLSEKHDREETKEIFANNPGFTFIGLETHQNFTQESDGYSMGIFGEINYDLTELTRLTVGARYSYEQKDYDTTHQVTGGTFDIGPAVGAPFYIPFSSIFIDDASQPIDVSTDESWSSVTGKVSLSHQFQEDMIVYATLSNGFKAGGFNPEPANAEAVSPYDEETVVSIELGFKAELLDRRLRLNAAIFDSAYDDIQTEGFLPSGTLIVENAGEATIRGAEVEFTWLATENLTILGSYANYDATFDKLDNNPELEGEELVDVPRWTGHLGAIYEVNLDDSSSLRGRIDYRSRADTLTIRDAVVGDVERPGEDFFNASLSWMSADEAWNISLWGENLTDKAEIMVLGPSGLGTQPHVTYGAPRTYGISVTYSMK